MVLGLLEKYANIHFGDYAHLVFCPFNIHKFARFSLDIHLNLKITRKVHSASLSLLTHLNVEKLALRTRTRHARAAIDLIR